MRRVFRRVLSESKNVTSNLFKISLVSDMHINSAAVDDESFPNLDNPPMFYYTARAKLEHYIDFVNEQKPEAVIHLGDVIDGDNFKDSFDLFRSYWDTIDPAIKTSISAGNHDYTARINNNELGLPIHEYVSTRLGYGDRPYTAGSKMNESFAVTAKGISVRFINYDSNRISDGSFSSGGGYMNQDTMDWLEQEMLNSPENIIFFYSHKMRNYVPNWEDVETMLHSVKSQRPELKLYGMYGHSHIGAIYKYETSQGIPIYNCSALVDNLQSEHYTFYISEAGLHSIETHWVAYP